MSDLTRDRKVRVTLHVAWLAFFGLVACLFGAKFIEGSVGLVFGLFVPFATGLGTYLGLFINGNVKVHQATGGEK